MNCHECGEPAYFLCAADSGPTALCADDACLAQHARAHMTVLDTGRPALTLSTSTPIGEREHGQDGGPKPGELWRPTAGGPWVQILDVQTQPPPGGVLFDRGGEGVPGEWRPHAWFEREMRPLITLGSKWRFRDGSGKGIEVIGFQSGRNGPGVVFDTHAPNPFDRRAGLGQVHWSVREFLLKAVPESSP
jgi:hypothetical protein